MNGISALIKGDLRGQPHGDTWQGAGLPTANGSAGALVLDFPFSRTVRNTYMFLKPLSMVLLVQQHEGTKTFTVLVRFLLVPLPLFPPFCALPCTWGWDLRPSRLFPNLPHQLTRKPFVVPPPGSSPSFRVPSYGNTIFSILFCFPFFF